MEAYVVKEVRDSEKGVVLIVALFILLILTALGLSAVDTSVFEQKMSVNLLDRNTAFQAAESGLRTGEGFVENLAGLDQGTAACDTTTTAAIAAGGCVSTQNSVNSGVFANSATLPWGGTLAFDIPGFSTSGAGAVQAAPEYVVEYMTNLPDTNSSLGIGTGQNPPGSDFYRVTARGVGRTATAQAVVQSVYARRF